MGDGNLDAVQRRASELSAEWRSRLLLVAGAALALCTLSGVAIWLAPFSVLNQVNVILHTVLGLALLIPCAWYIFRHTARYWGNKLSHIMVLGYVGGAATLIAIVSGLVVTWNALIGTKLSYGWDLAHILSTVGVVAFVAPHIIAVLVLERRARSAGGSPQILDAAKSFGRNTAWVTAASVGVLVLAAYAYIPPKMVNQLPQDYSFKYGKDRPFAPSLARTASGGAMDPRILSGSRSCGTSGCHDEILKEWEISAHRWSAMDAGFQAIQLNMGKQNGPESTRYCGGCHDPISLFSGTKNLYTDTAKLTSLAGYQEGVSCLSCHSLRKVDLKGNANYVVAEPARYIGEFEYDARPTATKRLVRDFLIRAYPRQHMKDLSKRLFKTPEYCAACHKQFVDQEINNVGWVQLQNQYDNWRQSRWNHPGNATKTIECRECHMPLQDSHDPASGDALDYNRKVNDGKHRSHRFLAGNQMMPAVLKLPGWEKQVELTNQWLQGKLRIPEIEDKWSKGAAVGIEVQAPDAVKPGEKVPVKVVVTSNKVGHDFPTGPLDIIQAFVTLEVVDANGKVIYENGEVNEKHFIEPGTFMFKAEPVDQSGSLIDRHNLWEMVGVRYRRALFPGFSDSAEYAFECPGQGMTKPVAPGNYEMQVPKAAKGTYEVRARLRYRKVDQFLLNFIFGEKSGLTAPITELSSATKVIRVEGPAGKLASGARAGGR